ncbi:MAG TPA: bifunctional DNA primase/polymerase, partial [Methanomicrobia archaeon]|nr:bifunctional DNA primase/polymerase [Methanomicrobia archaeon]HEX59102.1 bifunctional DNA primase/polymerase [Methanomicrobia archaeon]
KVWESNGLSPEDARERALDELSGFEYGGELNVAVIGGEVSGNLLLIDIEDAREVLEPEWLQPAIEKTTKVKTGKPHGGHMYFRVFSTATDSEALKREEEALKKLRTEKGANGEIRWGGYVVAPPSVHPNGKRYEFVTKAEPVEIDASKLEDLLKWARIAIKKGKRRVKPRVRGGEPALRVDMRFIEDMKRFPPEKGKRSDWLFAATLFYKLLGFSPEDAYDEIFQIPICRSKLEDSRGYDWWLEYEWRDVERPTVAGLLGALLVAQEQTGLKLSDEAWNELNAAIKRREVEFYYSIDGRQLVFIFKPVSKKEVMVKVTDGETGDTVLPETIESWDFLQRERRRASFLKNLGLDLQSSSAKGLVEFLLGRVKAVKHWRWKGVEEKQEEREKEKEKKEWLEEALRSPTLAEDIYESLGKPLVGNATLRRNLVYDLALVGAPKITLGNPASPVRSVRPTPAVWLVGPAESGKSLVLKLVEEIAPKAFFVTRITEAALDRGFAEQVDGGVLIVPEADAIYRAESVRARTGKPTNFPEDAISVQLRTLVEDQKLVLVTTELSAEEPPVPDAPATTNFTTVVKEIPLKRGVVVFMASTWEPHDEQLRTRYKIYRMEKSPSLTFEAMRRFIDGLLWKEQPGKWHPHELREIYREIYKKVSELDGYKFTEEAERELLKMAMHLCVMFMPTEVSSELPTREELAEKIEKDEVNEETLLQYLDAVNSDILLNRRFEDVVRRIIASACLHVYQREIVEENGKKLLVIAEDDLKAGWELVKDIEREFAPQPSVEELCVAVLREAGREMTAAEVAEKVYSKLGRGLTRGRIDYIRDCLNKLSSRGIVQKCTVGRHNYYAVLPIGGQSGIQEQSGGENGENDESGSLVGDRVNQTANQTGSPSLVTEPEKIDDEEGRKEIETSDEDEDRNRQIYSGDSESLEKGESASFLLKGERCKKFDNAVEIDWRSIRQLGYEVSTKCAVCGEPKICTYVDDSGKHFICRDCRYKIVGRHVEAKIFELVEKAQQVDERGLLREVLLRRLSEFGDVVERKLQELIENGDLFVYRDESGEFIRR